MTIDADVPAMVARQTSDLIERPGEGSTRPRTAAARSPSDGDPFVLMTQREAASREQPHRIAVPIIAAALKGYGSPAERPPETSP